MLAVKASGVCHSYGGEAVLKNFSFELEKGGFTALMGPSGAGKSTFLHLAAGLIAPKAGSIEIGGTDIATMGDGEATRFRRRHIGVVFQNFNLLDSLDVAGNITLPSRIVREKPDLERMRELVGKLSLEGLERRMPRELSGGERQRVAIARALYPGPDAILADEPTGNLDMKSARAICRLFGEINRSEKSAILLVTHDPVVASCASRVCFLVDGAIAAVMEGENDPSAIAGKYLEICK